MSTLTKKIRFLQALHIIVLCCVLLGAFGVQIFLQEEPCPLCFLQRLAMTGIAVALLCNLRFGVRPLHYGLAILSCIFGASISLRQTALHICPQFPTFGEPIWGFDLYWWACIVFASSLFVISVELFLFRKEHEKPYKLNPFEWTAFGLFALIVLGNFISVFSICGLGACKG
jgi:disulfide bond formation protein DsbB